MFKERCGRDENGDVIEGTSSGLPALLELFDWKREEKHRLDPKTMEETRQAMIQSFIQMILPFVLRLHSIGRELHGPLSV